MSLSQSCMPVHSMASRAKTVIDISVQPVHQQRTKKLHSSTVVGSSISPPISARSYNSIPGTLDLAFNSSDQSLYLVEHSRHLATTVPTNVNAAPPSASLNSSRIDFGLLKPPEESPLKGCCTPNMVQKRGTRDCHCVYPVKIELFLRNVSLTSNWSNEFLDDLAPQLNLRVTQFEIISFAVVRGSGLNINITMDIAPHTGVSFSADEVANMNYSLNSHTVRINPVLVGDYNLLNLTWFGPFAPAPAPAFTISPKASPSTTSSSLRPKGAPSNDKRPSRITVMIICAAALIGFLLVILAVCYCILGKARKMVSPVETLSGLLRACFFVVLRLFWKRSFTLQRNNRETKENIELILSRYGIRPKRYKYNELKMMTRSFSKKLGGGGYGMVFKGVLRDGRIVAVKLLHNSRGDGEEFVNEVVSIVNTSHINIVCLLGFCLEGSRRGLVYEYMTNGSLERYIYSENPKSALGWEQLYEIAIGIARGLEYLHKGCNRRIIHFDIKPHNILLDENYSPKIADFGLAKLCNPKESIVSMAGARGTIGFIAPEVFSRSFGVVSTKSDIYSFGMMLLEMVGGRRNVQTNAENSSQVYLPQWLHDHLSHGGRLENFEVTSKTEEIARKMAMIGLWCIQMMPEARPSITKVIEMLERSVTEIEVPPMQFFSCPSEPSIHSSTINTTSGEDV